MTKPIRHVSDHVGVMYLGEIVETGPTEDVFSNPAHPYTEALLAASPRKSSIAVSKPIPGEIPSVLNPPSGCAFSPRCSYATSTCRLEQPQDAAVDQKVIRCFHPLKQH
ncbi:MAG: oligopeptide/dipeptide ABC transporter ATP-binding protein [Sulfitobacter sp.]